MTTLFWQDLSSLPTVGQQVLVQNAQGEVTLGTFAQMPDSPNPVDQVPHWLWIDGSRLRDVTQWAAIPHRNT